MASQTEIYNRALSKLGAARVNSPTENTRNAKACHNAYEIVRDALLREYRWAFAVRRAQIAAAVAAPEFGPSYKFPLPADYLRLLPPDDESTPGIDDRMIEADAIVTDSEGPLDIIYLARIEDTSRFNASFVKALACDLAFEICQEITRSTSKKESLRQDRKEAIREARRTGAIERRPTFPRTDSWISVRNDGVAYDETIRGLGLNG